MSEDLRAFHIYDLGGGENNYEANDKLQDNEASETVNTFYEEGGVLQKRHTLLKAVAGSLGEVLAVGAGLYMRAKFTGAPDKVLIKTGSTILKKDTLTAAATEWKTSMGGSRMRWLDWHENTRRVYLALGSGKNAQRYGFADDSGTQDIYEMGVAPPDAVLPQYADDGAAGTTQDGYFCVGWTLTLGPSGAWGESELVRAPNGYDHTGNSAKKYKTTKAPSEIADAAIPGGYYSIKLYATEGGYTTDAESKAAPMFYTGQETTDLDGTVNLEWEDSDLDFTTPAPTSDDTGDLADKTIYTLCQHNLRLWCCSTGDYSKIYYSNLNMPDEFPTNNHFSVPDSVYALVSFQGDLIMLCKNSIWRMRGWVPNDFNATLECVVNDVGCHATDSVAQLTIQGQPMLIFANRESVWAFDGQRVHDIGYKIRGTISDITGEYIDDIRAVAHQDHYLLAYAYGSPVGGINNRLKVFDRRTGVWHSWGGASVGAFISVFDTFTNKLFFLDDTARASGGAYSYGTALYQMGTGYEACDFRFRTKYYAPEGPQVIKDFKRLYVKVERNSLPLGVRIYLDGQSQGYGTVIPAPDPGGKWTSDQWGEFKWGPSMTDYGIYKHEIQSGLIGREFAIEFYRDNDSANKKIAGFTMMYSVEGGLS